MIYDQKIIKYKGKQVFEKLVLTSDFKRIPKYFAEDEACFLFIKEGSFQFRTPTNLLKYTKNEAMLAKCGNYFLEDISINETDNKLAAIGAFFYPEKEFFATDLSLKHFAKPFDVKKVNIEPLVKLKMTGLSNNLTSDFKYYVEYRRPSAKKAKAMNKHR